MNEDGARPIPLTKIVDKQNACKHYAQPLGLFSTDVQKEHLKHSYLRGMELCYCPEIITRPSRRRSRQNERHAERKKLFDFYHLPDMLYVIIEEDRQNIDLVVAGRYRYMSSVHRYNVQDSFDDIWFQHGR